MPNDARTLVSVVTCQAPPRIGQDEEESNLRTATRATDEKHTTFYTNAERMRHKEPRVLRGLTPEAQQHGTNQR